jgi:hypothetical protein
MYSLIRLKNLNNKHWIYLPKANPKLISYDYLRSFPQN